MIARPHYIYLYNTVYCTVYKYVATGITGPPIQFHALWPGREAFNLWASSTSCWAFPETIYSKEYNPRSLDVLIIYKCIEGYFYCTVSPFTLSQIYEYIRDSLQFKGGCL
jgi:hypothetical protein